MLKLSTTEIQDHLVKYGTKKIYIVNVENPSKDPIAFTVNATSCSCTQGSVNPNPISPNSTSELTVSFDSVKAGMGDMTKTLKVSWFHNGTTYSEVIKLKVNVSRS